MLLKKQILSLIVVAGAMGFQPSLLHADPENNVWKPESELDCSEVIRRVNPKPLAELPDACFMVISSVSFTKLCIANEDFFKAVKRNLASRRENILPIFGNKVQQVVDQIAKFVETPQYRGFGAGDGVAFPNSSGSEIRTQFSILYFPSHETDLGPMGSITAESVFNKSPNGQCPDQDSEYLHDMANPYLPLVEAFKQTYDELCKTTK